MKRAIISGALLFCTAVSLFAQASDVVTAPAGSGGSAGLYGVLSSTASKDSLGGYSNELIPSVGYDVNSRLAIELGVPYYPLVGTQVMNSTTVGGTATTEATDATNVLGDIYGKLVLNFDFFDGRLRYQTALRAAAPTGDTASGISTGSATWNWANHVETGDGRIIPFLEAGLGNSLSDSIQYHRDYTTLGYVAPFAAGIPFDIRHDLSFTASTYYDLPFGEQKLYSQIVRQGPVATRRGNRPIATEFFSQGGASLAEDHGYNGILAFSPTQRLTFSLSYNRSVPYALDSVVASISVRIGHMGAKSNQAAH